MSEETGQIVGAFRPEMERLRGDCGDLSRRMEILSRQSELQFQTLILSLEAFRAEMRATFYSLRTAHPMEGASQQTVIADRVVALEARLSR